jgi:hypothetical protein
MLLSGGTLATDLALHHCIIKEDCGPIAKVTRATNSMHPGNSMGTPSLPHHPVTAENSTTTYVARGGAKRNVYAQLSSSSGREQQNSDDESRLIIIHAQNASVDAMVCQASG